MLSSTRVSFQWTPTPLLTAAPRVLQGRRCHHARQTSALTTLASNSTKLPDWRGQVVAQEELSVTAPHKYEDSSSQITTNDDQIEKLLAHIHKRLPHSKPARALLQDNAHTDANEPTADPEYHTISSQLQLSLEGGGIHLSVLGDDDDLLDSNDGPAAAESLHIPGFGLEATHDAALTSFSEVLAASWPVPGIAEELELELELEQSHRPGHVLTDALGARQREWLQQLLDRPYAPPSAPPHPRISGARTKQCDCGCALHNRVAICPECGHEFYRGKGRAAPGAARVPRPRPSTTAAAPAKQRMPPSSPHAPAAAALSAPPSAFPEPLASGASTHSPSRQQPTAQLKPTPHQPTSGTQPPANSIHPQPDPHVPETPSMPSPAAQHTPSKPRFSPATPNTCKPPKTPQPPNSVEDLAGALSIPLHVARTLLASNSNLATLPIAKVSGRVALLASTLSVTRDLAVSLATRQPSLLSLTPATLHQHFEGLCAHLHLHPRETRRIVAKCPDLLLMAPATAARKLSRLAIMLRISPMQVLRLLMSAPKVLSLSMENIRGKLLFFRNTLALTQPARLHKVLRAHPSLLTRSVASMQATFSGTAQVLGLREEEARRAFQLMPTLLYKQSASVEVKVLQLAELLGVEMEQATRLAAQNLCLLGMDASGWELKVEALAAALALPRGAVVKMLARMPTLLGLKPKPLGDRLTKMAAKLKLPKERVRQMVVAQPSLLTMKYAVLSRRWQALSGLAAAEPSWRAQLLGYEVSTMGMLLSRSDDTFLRLQYLLHVGDSSNVALVTAVQYKPLRFRAKYPEYVDWVNEEVMASFSPGRKAGKGGLRAFMKGAAQVAKAAGRGQ